MEEFRALIECTEDPCTYCHREARRFPAEKPGEVHLSEAAARQHGLVVTRNVYGASTHRVLVEKRFIGPWEETR